MKLKSVALVSLLFAWLVGCGGPAQQGYLGQPDANSAQFLQVTRNGTSLSGNLQSASISASDPTNVITFNSAFTGTTDGNAITLTFPQGLGFTSSISGSYSSGHIDLSVPQTDGTLATEDFAPSDTNAYNSAVHALQQQAQQALAGQQAAAAAQQQAQQEAEERAAVDQAIAAVKGDFNAIAGDINYKSLYASVNSDKQQAYRDTVTAYNDLKTVQAEGPNSLNCGADAGTVAADAGTVEADLGTLSADQGTEQADVATTNSAVGMLSSDFQKLQGAQAAIPSYQPAGLQTATQVSKERTAASKANSQANAVIAGALKQGQAWVNQANRYATNASAICG